MTNNRYITAFVNVLLIVFSCNVYSITMEGFITPFEIIEPEIVEKYNNLYSHGTPGSTFSPVTGTVNFSVVDIDLPGNFNLPVKLERILQQDDAEVGGACRLVMEYSVYQSSLYEN
ncbi:hypothetical protein [Colwellia sp. E2M01]|uniref:hypothetical protein n=1 Tax=Colwellia sp. E2M01 TaxID=2841561 RepID=UPI001C09485C|nr:hypothetical protein [Colwellia sp. E2M01]MBU2870414.1 hypothetical protein [Colwellia sp. E2M01]